MYISECTPAKILVIGYMIPMISILQYKYCSSPTYACSRNQIICTRVNVLTTGAVNIKECLKPKIAISKGSRLSASKLSSQRLYISKYNITVGEWTIYRLKIVEWNSIKAFDRITIHIHVYYQRLLWGINWTCGVVLTCEITNQFEQGIMPLVWFDLRPIYSSILP